MGSTISSIGEIPATIVVVLDQTVVYPGNFLSGKVYLNVSKDSGCNCSAVMFKVVGGEYTTARYTTKTHSGSGKHRRTHVHHHVVHGRYIIHIFFLRESLLLELQTNFL